jgi:hypothetical protein
VICLTAKKLVWLVSVGFEKTLPGFDQHRTAKCSTFALLFGADHYQSLELALPNVGLLYLKVELLHVELCKDIAF